MSERLIRVYDVFDTVATSNIYDLLKQDDTSLYEQAQKDFAKVRDEVLSRDKAYRAAGKIKTVALPRVRETLVLQKSKGFALGAFSNGTLDDIITMLSEAGLNDLFDERVSIDTVGNKDKHESYLNLQLILHAKGLTLTSYADDKAAFCKAAADAFWMPGEELATPRVYHVNSKNEPAPENCVRVASIADIG